MESIIYILILKLGMYECHFVDIAHDFLCINFEWVSFGVNGPLPVHVRVYIVCTYIYNICMYDSKRYIKKVNMVVSDSKARLGVSFH